MANADVVQPDNSYRMGVEDAADRLYRNKVILAPMVRAGTLPLRALALRYGADTVFTEEIIDRRVVNAVRTENPVLGTVDYVEQRGKKGTATPFQTCAMERERVVYQIGTGDATNALRAAQHVERDVAGVDVNMGCPKRFSLQGCMGAALLKRPEIAADIVGTLRRNLSVPVSAKIRLLGSPSETVEFARRMEKAGACALTVHVRQVEDKPASKARWEELRPVVDAVNIPVIANGDVYTRADMANIKALSGCSSVMLARPALLNCSIFKPDGKGLPLKEVIQQYLRECFRYDSIYQNAKYTVMEMLTKRRHPDHLKASLCLGLPAGAPGMREVTPAKTLRDLAMLWDVGSDYDAENAKRRERALQLGGVSASEPAERSCIHKFDDAYFLEPESVKAGSGATPAPPVVRGGGGGGSGGGVAGEGMAAAKALPVKSAENAGVLRVEVPSEAGVHGGGACLNGTGGAGRDGSSKEGAFCEREQAERRADFVEGVVAQADPGVGGGGSVSSGGVRAGVEERRNNGACTELGLGDSRRHAGSACQILAATDRACSKRPRKEEERGAL